MVKEGAKTIECEHCGTSIRDSAHKCHNCGAKTNPQNTVVVESQSTISVPDFISNPESHSPSEYDTTVSGRWEKAILVGILVFSAGIMMSSVSPEDSLYYNIGVLLYGIFWLLIPISFYFDIEYIRANSAWYPNKFIWIPAVMIPLINIPICIAYFYRRKEVL